MAPFRFHSLYWYYRRYNHRAYAELARCALSLCVLIDQLYCRLTGRRQRYAPQTARAAFRGIATIRRDYEQRVASQPGGGR